MSTFRSFFAVDRTSSIVIILCQVEITASALGYDRVNPHHEFCCIFLTISQLSACTASYHLTGFIARFNHICIAARYDVVFSLVLYECGFTSSNSDAANQDDPSRSNTRYASGSTRSRSSSHSPEALICSDSSDYGPRRLLNVQRSIPRWLMLPLLQSQTMSTSVFALAP